MLKWLRKNLFAVLAAFYSLVVALFWLALRVNWSGMSKAFGADKNQSFFIMQTPLIICVLLWLAFAFSLVALFLWGGKKKWPFITSVSISGVFTIAIIVVIAMGAIDYMNFILPDFFLWLAVSLLIIAFALLLFFPPTKNTKLCIGIKGGFIAVIVLMTVLIGFDVKVNFFTYDSVVYAVEDKYQIVFSTNDQSIAWVEIGDDKYYDLYAGSMKSKDLVHKIEVPQSALDNAKSYKICAQSMLYRGPFGGYKGGVIEKTHTFRPIDMSDGFKYYTVSDVHMAFRGAVSAASYHSDMDVFVMLGDLYSMIDTEDEAQFANKLAGAVTKGEYPVIYGRGNHEIKGQYAEDLHKYVGSKNGNFYYTVTLGNKDFYGIMLDLGEDHDDDWWEYYDTAQFDLYRDEQTQLLTDIKDNNLADGYKYKLAMCHIPVPYVNGRHNHEPYKKEWTTLLNEIGVDMFVSGHQHDLIPFVPNTVTPFEKPIYNPDYSGKENKKFGGYLTDFNFPGFIVSRRSNAQLGDTQRIGTSQFTGLITEVNFTTGKQTSSYTNSAGETVKVFNPFVNDGAHTEFTYDLIR
ncbi:MAG: metallophosphoesterase [Corallococcus sp.]|nr:metallophosphoesterase [Corallococcus sp.]